MKLLNYKGFYGSIEVNMEDDFLYGKVEFIEPLVNYKADSAHGLVHEFKNAIDGYLVDCETLGKEPAKPYKGSFNVRIGSVLHRQALIAAKEKNMNLNEFVRQSIQQAISLN